MRAGRGRIGVIAPQRICAYRHLAASDRVAPGSPGVFFDPVDTEVGIWATVDLVVTGCTILDLGSGSGASARALARAGARHVHGVDISRDSVEWARRQRSIGGRTTFAIADYASMSASELVAACPFDGPPTVVTSNPPYVPLPSRQGAPRVSIDGGADGLRLARVVVALAAEMGSDLAITLGSYSSPRAAAQLLAASGYGISAITLSALRIGAHTADNMSRVLELEADGEGSLLRIDDGVPHYVVMALSCRHAAAGGSQAVGASPTSDELLDLVRVACLSCSAELEALDSLPAGWSVPIRILRLADEARRHHA